MVAETGRNGTLDISQRCAFLSFQKHLAYQSRTVFHETSFVNSFHLKDFCEYIASVKSSKNVFVFSSAGDLKVCVNFFSFVSLIINFERYF